MLSFLVDKTQQGAEKVLTIYIVWKVYHTARLNETGLNRDG
jgi:hypothetical protein